MTYDSSVFQGETITKIVFISKIQKDFGIYLLLIFRYIAKKRSMLLRKGQPVRQTASSAPKLRLRRGGLPPRTVKSPGYLRPDKKPPRKPGRAKFQGWLADCIGRGHKPASFPMLQNYPAAISSLRQSRYNPGNMALHARCSSRQSRSTTPPGHKSSLPGL